MASSLLSVMSFGVELRVYLLTLKGFGLLCISPDAQGLETHVSGRDETVAVAGLLGSQFLALMALCHLVIMNKEYEIPMYGQVGNTYYKLTYGLACLTVMLIHLCFFVQRHRFESLISQLICSNRLELQNREDRGFLRTYALFASQVLLTFLVCVKVYVHNDLNLLQTLVMLFISTYSYIMVGLVIAFHNYLVRISTSLMQLYNKDLASAPTLSQKLFSRRLRHQTRLLHLCQYRINHDFGIPLVLVMSFVLLSAPGAPFFLIFIVFEMDAHRIGAAHMIQALVNTLLWNLPYTLSILMCLRSDSVRMEVSPNDFPLGIGMS